MRASTPQERYIELRNLVIGLPIVAAVGFGLFALRWWGYPAIVDALGAQGLPGEGADRVLTFAVSVAIFVVPGVLVVLAELWWARSRTVRRSVVLVAVAAVWFIVIGTAPTLGRFITTPGEWRTLYDDFLRDGLDVRTASDWATAIYSGSMIGAVLGLVALGLLIFGFLRRPSRRSHR